MVTLSLPEFTIVLPVWLFSTSLVMNVQITLQPSSPHEQHQPQFHPLLSSPNVSSSLSSSLSGEIIDNSN